MYACVCTHLSCDVPNDSDSELMAEPKQSQGSPMLVLQANNGDASCMDPIKFAKGIASTETRQDPGLIFLLLSVPSWDSPAQPWSLSVCWLGWEVSL